MALEEYKKKRKFGKTPEPRGKRKKKKSKKPVFVVQEHHARTLHYDFRLELDGVLKSWAVPKGVPAKIEEKRLAVMTEDHPLEYAKFEGTIPEGLYGAGRVKIFDRGTFELWKRDPALIKVWLRGKRFSGEYVLIKLKPTPRFKGKRNWLLFKRLPIEEYGAEKSRIEKKKKIIGQK